MIAPFLMCLALGTPSTGSVEVSLRQAGDETLISVRARAVHADDVLRELASKTGRDVIGLDESKLLDAVDVELVDRPLDAVVDWVAGAAGMRAQVKARSIAVRPDLSAEAKAGDAADMADVMYVRALHRYPDALESAEAELTLGKIQESRGNDVAARLHYDTMLLKNPDSHLGSEALLHSARIQMRLEEWTDAAKRWSKLANRPQPNEYAVSARVEMARCLALSPTDGPLALPLIDSIETNWPATNGDERADRLYVRAAALVASKKGDEAMRVLESAMRLGLDQASSLDALRIRAAALELIGRPGEASLAWLAFASECSDKRRDEAYFRAATSAAQAKDFLGVLFIERTAAVGGHATRIRTLADEARSALGLVDAPTESLTDRIGRAERAFDADDFAEAGSVAEAVWSERAKLDENDVVRALVLRVRCTEIAQGVDPAITQIKEALGDVRRSENRKRLYLLAGELYEKHQQWDLAAGAYGGRL